MTKLYALRIKLLDIEPAVWRRFTVPADISLDRLHDVIQIVMGWEDCHLHQFAIQDKTYSAYPEDMEQDEQEATVRLGDLVKRKGATFTYTYDFGDSWEHSIVVESATLGKSPNAPSLLCLAGERACPPEDVGGPPGYAYYLEALADPKHPEHEELLEWQGPFDPEDFHLDDVNYELFKYLGWTRPRLLGWQAG